MKQCLKECCLYIKRSVIFLISNYLKKMLNYYCLFYGRSDLVKRKRNRKFLKSNLKTVRGGEIDK